MESLALAVDEREVAQRILGELRRRLAYLDDVGIGYLTLDRLSSTLSGGESQRINLATSLGSSLVGAVYVLDEPSIGLHPRDNGQLIGILTAPPGRREHGDRRGTRSRHDARERRDGGYGSRRRESSAEKSCSSGRRRRLRGQASLTGAYLSGRVEIPVPKDASRGAG